jgi:hypothetical protein
VAISPEFNSSNAESASGCRNSSGSASTSRYGRLLRILAARRQIRTHRFHTRFRQPVDGHAPRRPRQKRPFVNHAFPLPPAIELKKCLLHHILGIVRISQNRIGYAEDKARLPANQRSETLVAAGGSFLFCQGWLPERDL